MVQESRFRDWARRVCQLKSVSAIKIEKIYRGFISRRLTMKKRKMYQRACVIIQAIIRMYQARIRKMRLARAKVGFLLSSSCFFELGSIFLLDYHTPFWYTFHPSKVFQRVYVLPHASLSVLTVCITVQHPLTASLYHPQICISE